MKRIGLQLCTILLGFSAGVVEATRPAHWTISTRSEFLQGESKGVSVTSDGRLTPAPALLEVLDAEEAFIYSAVRDKSGNLYLGSGNTGKVFRLRPRGEGGEWGRVEEPGVYSLTVDSLSRVYAGSGPDGKVYRFNNGGQAQVFFDPKQKYIWALSMDSQNNLFVGTGPKGIVYKVDPQGNDSVLYDSRETHIVSLGWDINGDLLAGTDPGGLLFRISPSGSPFVLFDSPLREVKALTVDRYGNIYLAALGAPASSPQSGSSSQKTPGAPSSSVKKRESKNSQESTIRISGTEPGSQLQIYRIDKGNLVETLYTSNDQVAFDLLVQNDGSLLVATGNKGRIISIDSDRFVTLLVDTPEEQVTQLLENNGQIYAATSNLGKVFQLHSRPSSAGTYESRVLDGKMPSGWGVIRWRTTGSLGKGVKLYTRSGNTKTPDETWSQWNGPYEDATGSYIDSPTARFLQWKAEFRVEPTSSRSSSDSSSLESVTVTYLERNMPPQVTSLTIHPSGTAFLPTPRANPGTTIAPGGPDEGHTRSLPRAIRTVGKMTLKPPPRKVYMAGARSLSWKSRDTNQDDLTYSVYYRSEEETAWKILKKNVFETYYTMDGKSFPDGSYLVKVVASDLPSNPPKQALESELVSKPFVIANSSPSVTVETPRVEGPHVSLQFTGRTRGSTIHQAEYSVDAQEWHILFPSDGIADSPTEQYRFSLENLEMGEHTITIRVVDSVGNITTTKTTLSIP